MVIDSTSINIFTFKYNNREYRIFALNRANECGDALFTSDTIFNVLDSDCIIRFNDYYNDIAYVNFSNGKSMSFNLINDSTVRKYIDIIRDEDTRPMVKDFLDAFTKFIDENVYPTLTTKAE